MNNVNLIGRLTRTPELRAVNPTTNVATKIGRAHV